MELVPEVTQVRLLNVPAPLLENVIVLPDAGCPPEPFPIVPVQLAGLPDVTDPGVHDNVIVWFAAV